MSQGEIGCFALPVLGCYINGIIAVTCLSLYHEGGFSLITFLKPRYNLYTMNAQIFNVPFSTFSVQFSRSLMSNSLLSHGLQPPGLPVHHHIYLMKEYTDITVHQTEEHLQYPQKFLLDPCNQPSSVKQLPFLFLSL